MLGEGAFGVSGAWGLMPAFHASLGAKLALKAMDSALELSKSTQDVLSIRWKSKT